MFKNFWYALAFSGEVTRKPSKHRLLGQDLVLWRDRRGVAHALSDVCIHRGASLSEGFLEDTPDPADPNGAMVETIVCPYHGWGYKADGSCARIPALRADRPLSKKARVDSYPVDERYGWVWVFPGDLADADRVPIPPIHEVTSAMHPDGSFGDGYVSIHGDWTWAANYERVVENGIDIAHTPWVHGEAFGNRNEPMEIDELDVEVFDWGAMQTAVQRPPTKAGGYRKKKHKGRPPEVTVRTAFFYPSIVMIDVTIPQLKDKNGNPGRQIVWDTNIPVEEDVTLTKFFGIRNFFTGAWANRTAQKRIREIFRQDDEVVRVIRPELVPQDLAEEMHLRSDRMSMEYRKCRAEATNRGWSVLGTSTGDLATRTVIASPARREPELQRAWVIAETPQGIAAASGVTAERN
ncbi:MAG TPA: aromatic ring-hydroxylating dioxygenase subunit alpha [Candidatus Nanopelagicales bacterium]|nr:aromatic ring-hydroxylating dioxygenase subunit alpha [Candidatus Nanopelagicales bacterium]